MFNTKLIEKMETVSIKISDLEKIIENAKRHQEHDSSLSGTLEVKLIGKADLHLASDDVEISLKSGYAECLGTIVGYTF